MKVYEVESRSVITVSEQETAIRGIQYCPRFGVSDSRYGLC